jgi:hypothetical protein
MIEGLSNYNHQDNADSMGNDIQYGRIPSLPITNILEYCDSKTECQGVEVLRDPNNSGNANYFWIKGNGIFPNGDTTKSPITNSNLQGYSFYWKPPPPPNYKTDPNNPPTGYDVLPNIDSPGYDLQYINASDTQTCVNACNANPSCGGFGLDHRSGKITGCFLKYPTMFPNGRANPLNNFDTFWKSGSKTPQTYNQYNYLFNTDFAASDIGQQMNVNNASDCIAGCNNNPDCTGFAFIRNASLQNACAYKNANGYQNSKQTPNPNVDLYWKNNLVDIDALNQINLNYGFDPVGATLPPGQKMQTTSSMNDWLKYLSDTKQFSINGGTVQAYDKLMDTITQGGKLNYNAVMNLNNALTTASQVEDTTMEQFSTIEGLNVAPYEKGTDDHLIDSISQNKFDPTKIYTTDLNYMATSVSGGPNVAANHLNDYLSKGYQFVQQPSTPNPVVNTLTTVLMERLSGIFQLSTSDPIAVLNSLKQVGITNIHQIDEAWGAKYKQIGVTMPMTFAVFQDVQGKLTKIVIQDTTLIAFIADCKTYAKDIDLSQFFTQVYPYLTMVAFNYSVTNGQSFATFISQVRQMAFIANATPDITQPNCPLTDTANANSYVKSAIELAVDTSRPSPTIIDQLQIFANLLSSMKMPYSQYSQYSDSISNLDTTANLQFMVPKFKIWYAYVSGAYSGSGQITYLELSHFVQTINVSGFGLSPNPANGGNFNQFLDKILDFGSGAGGYTMSQLTSDINSHKLNYNDFFNVNSPIRETFVSGHSGSMFDSFGDWINSFFYPREGFSATMGDTPIDSVYTNFGIRSSADIATVEDIFANIAKPPISDINIMLKNMFIMYQIGITMTNLTEALTLLNNFGVSSDKYISFLTTLYNSGLTTYGSSSSGIVQYIQTIQTFGVTYDSYPTFYKLMKHFGLDFTRNGPKFYDFMADMNTARITYGPGFTNLITNLLVMTYNMNIYDSNPSVTIENQVQPILRQLMSFDTSLSQTNLHNNLKDYTYTINANMVKSPISYIDPNGNPADPPSPATYHSYINTLSNPTEFDKYLTYTTCLTGLTKNEYQSILSGDSYTDDQKISITNAISQAIIGANPSQNAQANNVQTTYKSYNNYVDTANMLILFPFLSFEYMASKLQSGLDGTSCTIQSYTYCPDYSTYVDTSKRGTNISYRTGSYAADIIGTPSSK